MKTLAALREKGHILHEGLIQKILDLPGVVVTAKEQHKTCPALRHSRSNPPIQRNWVTYCSALLQIKYTLLPHQCPVPNHRRIDPGSLKIVFPLPCWFVTPAILLA